MDTSSVYAHNHLSDRCAPRSHYFCYFKLLCWEPSNIRVNINSHIALITFVFSTNAHLGHIFHPFLKLGTSSDASGQLTGWLPAWGNDSPSSGWPIRPGGCASMYEHAFLTQELLNNANVYLLSTYWVLGPVWSILQIPHFFSAFWGKTESKNTVHRWVSG